MNKKYSIFISSTCNDLKEYRNSIHNAVIKSGHFPIAMEDFPASHKSQWEVIKPLIDECDYYILILGFSYGSIDSESKVSYTEKEYEYAMFKNKPVLSFLLDESFETTKDCTLTNIENFRKKVLSNNQISQPCEDKNNLSFNITNTLKEQYDQNPQYGWIRANQYNKLEQDYKELLSQYEELIDPMDLSDLKDIDKEIVLTGNIDENYDNWYGKSTLKNMFLLVAKQIFDYFPEDILYGIISRNIQFGRGIPEYSISIDNESKRKVRNKLKKLGLITFSDITRDGKTSILWKITKKGKYFYSIDDDILLNILK